MKQLPAILALLAALTPAGRAETYVVVFDFAGDATLGPQLADSVRVGLRRDKSFNVIDRLTTAELTPAGGIDLKTPDEKIVKLLKGEVAAHVAVFGRVEKVGDLVRAEARCVDISPGADGKPPDKPAAWTKVFSDETERARGVIAAQTVEAVRSKPNWKPPETGDETEPKTFGPPLNKGGDFEAAAGDGWQKPDNVSMKIVPDGRAGRTGNVLRLFTDLDREAWLAYQKDIRLGKADPEKPPPIGTVANKYATVAGLEGVHFRSAWIDATAGQRYWLVADMKGKTAGIFFPKIFVKGFADFSAAADAISEVSLNERKMSADDFAALPAEKQKAMIAEDAAAHPDRYRREVYRWYLACRNEEDVWKHYADPFPPRGGLPKNVQWLRIEVYAYWPPGEFLFDDVQFYKDPRLTAPQPEEPARTPGNKPGS